MVRIGKNATASEIILANPQAITVFERLDIPLGMLNKSIYTVCREEGIRPYLLLNLLNLTLHNEMYSQEDFEPEDALRIVDYLLRSHDFYSLEAYPHAAELVRRLGEEVEEQTLPLIERFFTQYTQEVEEHFLYEKEVAFPYIRTLFSDPARASGSGYCMHEYRQKHNDVQEKLEDLQNLLIRYLPPSRNYSIRRRLFLELTSLGDDLKTHTLIEDFILIPLVEREEQRCSR